VAVVLATAIGIGGVAVGARAADGGLGRRPPALQAYYTAPVLVRFGERVTIPVDVVCATVVGGACPTRVTLGAADADRAFVTASGRAAPTVRFDVTAPAERAASAPGSSGVVRYYLRASSSDGRSTSVPAGAPRKALRFFVTGDMPTVHMPGIPFGHVREGTPALTLPWGSGPMRAGIALGNEAAVLGPSSFDVDRRGRIFLLDSEQQRLAVFDRGRLVRSTPVAVAARSDVAVAANGVAYVLSRDRTSDRLLVTAVPPEGSPGQPVEVGSGIPAAIRTDDDAAYVYALPLDAWLPVPGTGAIRDRSGPAVGQPIGRDRELLRVAREHSLRLGIATETLVTGAVEILSRQLLGAVPLAAADGDGGYWAVAHVWRQGSHPADQYQAVHVADGRVTESFAMPRREFAQGESSAFRIGGDGDLYQMLTGPAGLRIVRYGIGGAR
jgi:hypothetical protein